MGDERREDDGPHAFRHDEPEENIEGGNEKREHEELAQLNAHVERQQRCQQVRAGELQRVLEAEREPESVDETEQERMA